MDGELKKLTFSMDKANGESRTVIVIGNMTTNGTNWVRMLYDRAISVQADETMRLIKEEVIENPGIVGMTPSSVIVDDFTELEQHVVDSLQPMLGGNNEPIWKQHRPYGKKNRRRFK